MITSKEFLATAAIRAQNLRLVKTVLQRFGTLIGLATWPALGLTFKYLYDVVHKNTIFKYNFTNILT